MVRMPCGLERAKNRRGGSPGNPFPLKHLPDGRIVRAAYHGFCHLDREVQITNLPGKNCRLDRIAAKLDFQNGLGGLRDDIAFSGSPVKDAPVDQNLIEVETELPSILCHTSPAVFGQSATIRGQDDDRLAFTLRIFLNRANNLQCGGGLRFSKQKIPLRHRQLNGWLAAQFPPIGFHGVGVRIDLDLRKRAVPKQVAFRNRTSIANRHQPLVER